MEIAVSLGFLAITLGCVVLALLALLRIGFMRLDSMIGIAHDGRAVGTAVPNWHSADTDGIERQTPALDRWQLLIFADRALLAFPDVIKGMHALAETGSILYPPRCRVHNRL
jgi:hypothetical protein